MFSMILNFRFASFSTQWQVFSRLTLKNEVLKHHADMCTHKAENLPEMTYVYMHHQRITDFVLIK